MARGGSNSFYEARFGRRIRQRREKRKREAKSKWLLVISVPAGDRGKGEKILTNVILRSPGLEGGERGRDRCNCSAMKRSSSFRNPHTKIDLQSDSSSFSKERGGKERSWYSASTTRRPRCRKKSYGVARVFSLPG